MTSWLDHEVGDVRHHAVVNGMDESHGDVMGGRGIAFECFGVITLAFVLASLHYPLCHQDMAMQFRNFAKLMSWGVKHNLTISSSLSFPVYPNRLQ